MDGIEIESLKEWLESWGDGPNWSDDTGQTVPIAKDTLRELLGVVTTSREALREIRTRMLDRTPTRSVQLERVSIAVIADDALDGGR